MTTVTIIALTIAAAAAVATVRARSAMRALYPEPLSVTPPTVAPAHDGTRPTAAVLLDHAGTEVSDFLLPYELLAASGAFNVHAVAPEHRPATLTGGLDVMPHLSFAGLARLPVPHVDLVVVPHLVDPDPALIDWLAEQARSGATVLTICTGAGVAAAAGLLDGRRATAHWGDLGRFERRYPHVDWVRGVRYVDDGDIVASAGITSGLDATLHVIQRLAGDDVMRRAAAAIGYTDLRYLDDPTSEQFGIEPADLVLPLRAALGRRPTVGVMLRDDVDEIAVAAAMDTYAATCSARLVTMTDDGRPVTTRHGLVLVPRATSDPASRTRVLVPAAAPGGSHGAFRHAIQDLADRHGRAIARFAAKRLEYRA